MLIGSHFLEDAYTDVQEMSNWFTPQRHQLLGATIVTQLALLFSHDEIWETCSSSI